MFKKIKTTVMLKSSQKFNIVTRWDFTVKIRLLHRNRKFIFAL